MSSRVKILRESDEGIFRGEGGKKNFWPPISPLREDMEPPHFYTSAPLRALLSGT